MSLSERVKRVTEFSDKARQNIQRSYEKDRHRFLAKNGIGLFTCGAAQESERIQPMIESMAEIVDYFFWLTSHEQTEQELELREKLEDALAEMEKE